MSRIAIVGSRGYPNRRRVEAYVRALPEGTIVVSGGAQGVDTWAEQAARSRGLDVEVYHADWKRYGKAAGPIRNAEVVKAADSIIAFWDGGSRGTKSTMALARRADKPLTVYGP